MQKTIYCIARDAGYHAIQHKYYTEDGYINTVFRIVSKEDAKKLKGFIKEKKNAPMAGFNLGKNEGPKKVEAGVISPLS